MGSYSRLAGGVFTDIVIISHSHVLGRSPKEQPSPCHLVSGFHFGNVVADNCFVEKLDSPMGVHECCMPLLAIGKAIDICLLIITTIVALDTISIYPVVLVFQRESILTRWR